MEFKASLDTLAKIITLGVTVLFIALGQQSLRELLMAKGNTTTILVHAGILLLFIAILLISWLYAPQSYTMDDTNLVINRAIGKVWIKLADIAQVRAVEPHEMIGTIRTFGVGGLFGYFGLYYNTKIGKTTLYTTQRQNRVLITTNQGQKIILSPDDLGMVEKIKSTL